MLFAFSIFLAQLIGVFYNIKNATASMSPAHERQSLELPRTVMFGVNSHHGLPLVEVVQTEVGPELKGGTLMRLGRSLASELGKEAEFLLMPKVRIIESLQQGRVDIICHVNPIWQIGPTDFAWWSAETLYPTVNVIAYFRGAPVKSLADLKGRVVATNYEFIYQNYDRLFQKGDLIREDGSSTDSNMQKLLKDRVPYVLLSDIEYNHYKKKYIDLKKFDPGWDKVNTRCALSKKSKISAGEFNRALRSLKQKGYFENDFFEFH